VGLGKPKLCNKFEVPSLSHSVNIEVEPQNFGEPKAMPILSYACDFLMVLGKPQLRAELKVASPSRCRNIIGEPQNFGELP